MKRSRINPVSEKRKVEIGILKELRAHVLHRAGFRCENCGLMDGLDVHHVTKRWQVGREHLADNLVALCRLCHEQTDWPFNKGRLCVLALGEEKFDFEVIFAADKWEARAL